MTFPSLRASGRDALLFALLLTGALAAWAEAPASPDGAALAQRVYDRPDGSDVATLRALEAQQGALGKRLRRVGEAISLTAAKSRSGS